MLSIRKSFVVLGALLLMAGLAACLALFSQTGVASTSASTVDSPYNCGPGWAVVSSPNVGPQSNYLNGVAIVSEVDVWAVGAYSSTTGVTQTLTMHYDGSQWAIVP